MICVLLMGATTACDFDDDPSADLVDDDNDNDPDLEIRDCNDSDLTLQADIGDEPFVETIDVELTQIIEGLSGPDEPIYVNLPEDLVGLSIIIEAGDSDTAMRLFEDGDEIDFPNPTLSKAKTINLPFNSQSGVEDACLAIFPVVDGDEVGEDIEVHLVARVEEADDPIFPVNFIIVGDTDISEDDLEQIAEFANEIYEDNGAPAITIQDIIDEEGPSVVDDEGDELDELRDTDFGDDEFALNVIFIQGFEDERVLGFAGGVPGPAGVTTVASAVVLSVDAHLDAEGNLQIDVMGSTVAHELGHQLGLFHTTEQTGDEFDPLDDTDECDLSNDADGDGEVDADECEDEDGPNLMFYETAEEAQTELSDEQVDVLLAHPLAF